MNENQLILEDEEVCDEPTPENIFFMTSRFGGIYSARCTDCRFVSVYFECAHDLEHDCTEYQNN